MSKVPRNLKGVDLAKLLSRYEYVVVRQTGNHIRLTSTKMGYEHHITIPAKPFVKIGTLSNILRDVAGYLEIEKSKLTDELFVGN